jgi:hypothetical protein
MHCNKSLLSLLLFNVIGDISVVEALLPLVCFVVSILDQRSFSTYPEIITKLAISFYSWDFINLLFMCVQAMKQGIIKGSRVFLYIFFLSIEAFFLSLDLKLYLFLLQHTLREHIFYPLPNIFLSFLFLKYFSLSP